MKHSNLKVFIIFLLLLTLIIPLTGCKDNQEEQDKYVIVESDDEEFQINIPENIEIEFYNNENYSLDLFSENDNFYLYASTIYKTREVDLLDYVKDDREYVLNSKQNTKSPTDIISLSVQDYVSYTYSFTYTDLDFCKDFYTQVVWIETSENIYILNFEVATENEEKYIQIINNIIDSFIEL